MGMLERQHRGLKDSLKAALVDMGDTHQERWLDALPFVLLGKNVAFQPDLDASPSELCFGTNVRIPGQILHDPGSLPDSSTLQEILKAVRTNTLREAKQPSRHNPPEKPLEDLPEDVTEVYARQHKTTGLQTPFEGPFKIHKRLTKSVIQLEVGVYKDGSKRFELRHLNDLRLAHPDSMAAPAQRPKLGRPSAQSEAQSSTEPLLAAPNPVDQQPNRLTPSQPTLAAPNLSLIHI